MLKKIAAVALVAAFGIAHAADAKPTVAPVEKAPAAATAPAPEKAAPAPKVERHQKEKGEHHGKEKGEHHDKEKSDVAKPAVQAPAGK